MQTYTHTGYRGYVGHYAVTVDAIRTPGKVHALNPSGSGYHALCGETVPEYCDDHHVNPDHDNKSPVRIAPDAAGTNVTCARCRKALKISKWVVQVLSRSTGRWERVKNATRDTRKDAYAAMSALEQQYRQSQFRVKQV